MGCTKAASQNSASFRMTRFLYLFCFCIFRENLRYICLNGLKFSLNFFITMWFYPKLFTKNPFTFTHNLLSTLCYIQLLTSFFAGAIFEPMCTLLFSSNYVSGSSFSPKSFALFNIFLYACNFTIVHPRKSFSFSLKSKERFFASIAHIRYCFDTSFFRCSFWILWFVIPRSKTHDKSLYVSRQLN